MIEMLILCNGKNCSHPKVFRHEGFPLFFIERCKPLPAAYTGSNLVYSKNDGLAVQVSKLNSPRREF